VIKKYLDEIKKINNGEVDVMSLENRTYLLAKGYLNIGTDSEGLNPTIGMNMVMMQNSQMLATYAILQMRMKAATELIKKTQKQWSDLLMDQHNWLGNICNKEGNFKEMISKTYGNPQ